MRKFATRLISYESDKRRSSATITPAAFHTWEKLRPNLVTLIGNGGFRALLSRAHTLANAEVPWLRTVHMNANGAFEGLEESLARLDRDEFLEGRAVLLAQLLRLLVAFIGEDLTLRMVREAWPKVSLNDLDFGTGDKE